MNNFLDSGKNDFLDSGKHKEKDKESNQFSQKSVYVREDDQDWGSAGMNDIQAASE